MRIFTEGSAGKIPVEVIQRETTQPNEATTTITVAATEEKQREEEASSAVGVIINQRHQSDTLEFKTPRRIGTDRQAAELFGILKVIESTDQNQEIKIELASKDTVDLLSNKIQDVEDKGYLGTKNADIIKRVMTGARKRKRKTFIRVIDEEDRAAQHRRQKALESARRGLKKGEEMGPDNQDDPRYRQSGMKLASMTQSLAYKMIRTQKMKNYQRRNRTNLNLAKAKVSMTRTHHQNPTDKEIWKGTKSKDFSREVRYFLMMTTHDGYMVGSNWERPGYKPELQARARCRRCQTTETMEHILTECQCMGQEVIWNQAKTLWEMKGYQWKKPDLGDILTCALPKFKKNRNIMGDSRLYRILISESARLIWMIRNDRVINERTNEATNKEVQHKWVEMMNRRLTLDRDMTHQKFAKKALSTKLVLSTWKSVLLNEETIDEDWTKKNSEVLVGIAPA
ncbi:hypothetical protein GG344DRAFT_38924 [Lentinula edodes]|nr:hypothetical protein GG344DRAFT_38924 [Lentinula edodes]